MKTELIRTPDLKMKDGGHSCFDSFRVKDEYIEDKELKEFLSLLIGEDSAISRMFFESCTPSNLLVDANETDFLLENGSLEIYSHQGTEHDASFNERNEWKDSPAPPPPPPPPFLSYLSDNELGTPSTTASSICSEQTISVKESLLSRSSFYEERRHEILSVLASSSKIYQKPNRNQVAVDYFSLQSSQSKELAYDKDYCSEKKFDMLSVVSKETTDLQSSVGSQTQDTKRKEKTRRKKRRKTDHWKKIRSILSSPLKTREKVTYDDLAESMSKAKTRSGKLSQHQKDSFSRPSRRVKKSNLHINQSGDGDVWVEKLYRSKKTGKKKIYFVSTKTGIKVRDEPPTGASEVVYLDNFTSGSTTDRRDRIEIPSVIWIRQEGTVEKDA